MPFRRVRAASDRSVRPPDATVPIIRALAAPLVLAGDDTAPIATVEAAAADPCGLRRGA